MKLHDVYAIIKRTFHSLCLFGLRKEVIKILAKVGMLKAGLFFNWYVKGWYVKGGAFFYYFTA